MTEAMGFVTRWLRGSRKGWLAWGGVVCYVLASPFLGLITWSAGQVWLGGFSHALETKSVAAIAAVYLARHHVVPFTIFGAVSLAIAFVGGLLLRRAVGQGTPEAEEV
jgi:hypothetical protein